MNIGLNLLFVAVTLFQTIRYALSENHNTHLLIALISITLFGIGGLYFGIRSERRRKASL